MQTLANNLNLLETTADPNLLYSKAPDNGDRKQALNSIYKQLFKENRNLEFFRNAEIDSKFLAGETSTRQTVCSLICSEMYQDYILMTNSNYHFVTICFERVLGRSPIQAEKLKWSSLLASEGLISFANKFTSTNEYMDVFGDDKIPALRSGKLFSSNQNTPALPKFQSIQRYTGPGNETQWYGGSGSSMLPWDGKLPPTLVRKAGAVFTVAGAIEVARVLILIVMAALGTGSI
ncbi:Phycobilisome linker polypeptide [[Leptolyngbya] sp. PCC 7376]|uniref:phycobilisome rod-core linker polypeptide n=1 Tax=[Leptolyngbya] sp. PCC 7376 TaxID=111781 RepID=UPI00029F47F4|nr:phycobilisome rod-core linker polypeptide [[Leptolyngbya] sp. PCC 7376]AFY37671.1 Phycobilisome linker polypeptide [[Leptolyngbya] sp. PCC 7376]